MNFIDIISEINSPDYISIEYVTEPLLRDTLAVEFIDFWDLQVQISPTEIIISGATVSTERKVTHKQFFTLTVIPFRIDLNMISFHVYEITPKKQEQKILDILSAHKNLTYEDHILRLQLLPCDFATPLFQTLEYTRLLDHKILAGLSAKNSSFHSSTDLDSPFN